MDQETIDAAIQRYYSQIFDEGSRLTTRSAQGRLEFERTQQIVRASTPAPGRILDVGGATGVHAAALAEAGYDVVLVEPVESMVQIAQQYGTFEARVGDARRLDVPDGSFDAVLMAGPLYHLRDRNDRVQALREAVRACRSGGVVHASAIPRFLVFAAAALDPEVIESSSRQWMALLVEGVPPDTLRFPAGHFHTPAELEDEMAEAGVGDVRVVGLEGPAAVALEVTPEVANDDYAAAAHLAAAFEDSRLVQNFSCHILGTGWVS